VCVNVLPVDLPFSVLMRAVSSTYLAQNLCFAWVLKAEFCPLFAYNLADADGVITTNLIAALGGLVVGLRTSHGKIMVVTCESEEAQLVVVDRRDKGIRQEHVGDVLNRQRVARGMQRTA